MLTRLVLKLKILTYERGHRQAGARVRTPPSSRAPDGRAFLPAWTQRCLRAARGSLEDREELPREPPHPDASVNPGTFPEFPGLLRVRGLGCPPPTASPHRACRGPRWGPPSCSSADGGPACGPPARIPCRYRPTGTGRRHGVGGRQLGARPLPTWERDPQLADADLGLAGVVPSRSLVCPEGKSAGGRERTR